MKPLKQETLKELTEKVLDLVATTSVELENGDIESNVPVYRKMQWRDLTVGQVLY